MYVQYQVPASIDTQPKPAVVMIHGCCLSAKTWETTPDGRMGWSRILRAPGVPDVSARPGDARAFWFRSDRFKQVRAGMAPPDSLPNILTIGHQDTWTSFRFGPTFGTAFPDEQFPVDAADEFYKQMIPDLNLMLVRTPVRTRPSITWPRWRTKPAERSSSATPNPVSSPKMRR